MLPSVLLRVDVHQTADGVAVCLTVLGATLAPDGAGPRAPGTEAASVQAAAPPAHPGGQPRRRPAPPAQADWAGAVLRALPTEGTRTRRDLVAALHGNPALITRALHALLEQGLVHQEGAGVRNDPYRYRRVVPEA